MTFDKWLDDITDHVRKKGEKEEDLKKHGIREGNPNILKAASAAAWKNLETLRTAARQNKAKDDVIPEELKILGVFPTVPAEKTEGHGPLIAGFHADAVVADDLVFKAENNTDDHDAVNHENSGQLTMTPDLSEELLAALRWLADHELWRDVYPDGPDMSVFDAIPPQHVRAAREALGLTAADLGYHRSPNAKISGPE